MITNQAPAGEQTNSVSETGSQTGSSGVNAYSSSGQAPTQTPHTPTERLIQFLETRLAAIGYDLVAIELINHREKHLRVFIDFPENSTIEGGIGIEDCVRVTHDLDEPLEANPDVEAIFKGTYELEVSSPGVDRPLRRPSDFNRFSGEFARLHTFRALTGEETQSAEYSAKNPKQKNFYGVLRGFEMSANGNTKTGSILFGARPEDGTRETLVKGQKKVKGQKGQNKKKETTDKESLKNETLIRVPLELISKANLEPQVQFPEEL